MYKLYCRRGKGRDCVRRDIDGKVKVQRVWQLLRTPRNRTVILLDACVIIFGKEFKEKHNEQKKTVHKGKKPRAERKYPVMKRTD